MGVKEREIAKRMQNLLIVRRWFSKQGEKLTIDEIKALNNEEMAELADLAREELLIEKGKLI